MLRKYPFFGYAISVIALVVYTGLLFFIFNSPLDQPFFGPGLSSLSNQGAYTDNKQIWTSIDGGQTWKGLASSAKVQGYYHTLTCPSPANCYGVGSSGRVLITDDTGQTWREQATGFKLSLENISCSTGSDCLALGEDDRGLSAVVTADSGKTWKLVSENISSWYMAGLYCPTPQNCFAVGQKGQVLATTNGGKTWITQKSGINYSLESIACVSASNCTAVGQAGTVIATTDGGQTWRQGESTFNGSLHKVACPSSQTCYALGTNGSNGKIIVSQDAGQTWNTLSNSLPGVDLALVCASASKCLAAGHSGPIKATADGGQNWVTGKTSSQDGFYSITCPAETMCYALTYYTD